MSKFSEERREMLKSTCLLVGATALCTIGGSLNAFAAGGTLQIEQPLGAPERYDSFVYFDGSKKGQDLMTADLVLDAPPITVQAKDSKTGKVRDSEHALVLVYRTSPDKIGADVKKGDTWHGIIAYSALCTYQGCQIKDWDAGNKLFVGPCEKCTFDPLNGGTNTTGKTRHLPQVPVGDHEGKLIVSDAIMTWIGVKRR